MIEPTEEGSCPVCGEAGHACRPVYSGGISIYRPEKETGQMYTLQARTYLDDHGKATTDPDKGAALLGIEGDQISEEDAKKYGLSAASGSMSYADLKAKAKELGLPASGSKADLEAAIEAAQASGADPSPVEVLPQGGDPNTTPAPVEGDL